MKTAMTNFLKQKLGRRQYKMLIAKHYRPNKRFLKKSKALFIQALKEEKIVTKKEPIRIFKRTVSYSFASFLAILNLGRFRH